MVSLYTNVPITEAVDVALSAIVEFHLCTYGLSLQAIREMLQFTLDNNTFHFEGNFYQQIRGLAMGSKISPILAILTMNHLESSMLFRRTLGDPPLFHRYIDDCVTTTTDDDAAFQSRLNALNTIHPTIKFEAAFPEEDGFLPILDCKVRLNDDGSIEHGLYVKKANKGLFIHASSNQPMSIKVNAIRSEMSRASSVSSNRDLLREATEYMTHKFLKNGYTSNVIERQRNRNNNTINNNSGNNSNRSSLT